jgi:hypothetical protein
MVGAKYTLQEIYTTSVWFRLPPSFLPKICFSTDVIRCLKLKKWGKNVVAITENYFSWPQKSSSKFVLQN